MSRYTEITMINYRLSCIQSICRQITSPIFLGPMILEEEFETLSSYASCNYSKLVENLVNSPDSIECSRTLIMMAQETNRHVESVISFLPENRICNTTIHKITYMTELIIMYCQRIMLHQNVVVQEIE